MSTNKKISVIDSPLAHWLTAPLFQRSLNSLGIVIIHYLASSTGFILMPNAPLFAQLWPAVGSLPLLFLLFGLRIWPLALFGTALCFFSHLHFHHAPLIPIAMLSLCYALLALGLFFTSKKLNSSVYQFGCYKKNYAFILFSIPIVAAGSALSFFIFHQYGLLSNLSHTLMLCWFLSHFMGCHIFALFTLFFYKEKTSTLEYFVEKIIACFALIALYSAVKMVPSGETSLFAIYATACLALHLWTAIKFDRKSLSFIVMLNYTLFFTLTPFTENQILGFILLSLFSVMTLIISQVVNTLKRRVVLLEKSSTLLRRQLEYSNQQISKEISSRTLAEYAGRKKNKELETLYNILPVGILKLNSALQCEFSNKGLSNLSGIKKINFFGKNWAEFLHAEDKVRVIAALEKGVYHKQNIEIDFRLHSLEGKITWVFSVFTFLKDPDETEQKIIGVIVNLTEIKKHEEAITEAQNKLEQTTKELKKSKNHLLNEQHLAKKIFDNIVHKGFIERTNIKHVISPISIFTGDLLLVKEQPDGKLNVLVGDFTSHGLPAAIGVIPVSDTFYSMSEKGLPAKSIIKQINKKLHKVLPTGVFCAACFMEINEDKNEFYIWNGGLPGVIKTDAQGKITEIFHSKHVALGILGDTAFSDALETHSIQAKEKLFIYSDGITETHNCDNDMFGEQRLHAIFDRHNNPDTLFPEILKTVAAFGEEIEQEDDLTLFEFTCPDTSGR